MKNRALNSNFLDMFKENGKFHNILEAVKKDDSLIMCMRGDYVTIYYKSLQILKIFENGSFDVDKKYVEEKPIEGFDVEAYFAKAKLGIDRHCKESKVEKLEKEVQQAIVRENNYCSISNATDYFIIDIEYTQNELNARFDALAVLWPRKNRKYGEGLRLAYIEVKAGEKAIKGTSGVSDHYKAIYNFIENLNKNNKEKQDFLEDLENVIMQQRELGLWEIGNNNHKISLSKILEPQLMFILVNYNQNSESIQDELENIQDFILEKDNNIPFELVFATSSFMGYGLYENCMISLENMQKRLVKAE